LFGLLGGKSKQLFFTGVNQKKDTGGKTGNDLYYRGKDLLTLKTI